MTESAVIVLNQNICSWLKNTLYVWKENNGQNRDAHLQLWK